MDGEVQLLNFHHSMLTAVCKAESLRAQVTQSMPCSLWHVTVHGTLQRSDSLIYLRQSLPVLLQHCTGTQLVFACFCFQICPWLRVFIRSTAPKAAPSEVQDKKGRQYMQCNAMQYSKSFFHCEKVFSSSFFTASGQL
jgi:hypothetical protein